MLSSPFLLLFLLHCAQPLLAPQQGHLGFHSRGRTRRDSSCTFFTEWNHKWITHKAQNTQWLIKSHWNTFRIHCCSYATRYPNAYKGCFNSLWELSPGNLKSTGRVCQWTAGISLESSSRQCPDAVLLCADRGGTKLKLWVQTLHKDRKPDIPALDMDWIQREGECVLVCDINSGEH